MKLTLADKYRSFATRGRAREIIGGMAPDPDVVVDASGVVMSPAFLAELFVVLAKTSRITLAADAESSYNLDLARNLVRQLGLSDRVRVEELAPA